MINRIYPALVSLLFLLFAWFQFNDPDPLIWVSYYLLLAGLGISQLRGSLRNTWRWLGFGASLVLLFQSAPGLFDFITNQEGYTVMEVMSQDKPWIELSREFGGALIGAVAIYFLKPQHP